MNMDMNIAGSGNIPSGEYAGIRIGGSGKLHGPVRCISFSCSGSCKGESIECTEDMRVSGSSSFSAGIRAGQIKVAGSLVSDSSVKADKTIVVAGSLTSGGDVEAEEIKVDGRISCKGLLNAENISVKTDGEMKVGSIGGSKIVILMKKGKKVCGKLPLFGKLADKINGRLSIEGSVEGDDIALEYTSCPRVTGRRVAIGCGCSIDLVQYSEEIEISPDATVINVEKI